MKFTKKIDVGDFVDKHEFMTIQSARVEIPDPKHLIHLQFRRYAGCPFCNLHLRSIVERYDEILAVGIRELVVFHSPKQELVPYQDNMPFAVIADPQKELYAEFGVASSLRAVLAPSIWMLGIRAVFKKPAGPIDLSNGVLGLPADFLIQSNGKVVARKYGVNAYDQWSVDEIVALGRTYARLPAQPQLSPDPR